MSEFTIASIITLIALLVIIFLLSVLYVTIGISRSLKLENEDNLYTIRLLKNELKLEKSKTK